LDGRDGEFVAARRAGGRPLHHPTGWEVSP
jgi:hypothetical protein